MISIFIPIRKGSKRVKDKNIKSLPKFRFGLTELKIKQLKKLKNIFKKDLEFVISTDCKKIKKFLSGYSWIKVKNRPKALSTDDSLDKLVTHVPKICKGKFILWTHVTSPLFNEIDYVQFIKVFLKNFNKKKNKSAFSADKIQKFIFRKDQKWISHNREKKKWPRTQDLPNYFVVNSAAFMASREVYIYQRDRLCNNPLPIESRYESGFDIDEKADFDLLIKKIKNGYINR